MLECNFIKSLVAFPKDVELLYPLLKCIIDSLTAIDLDLSVPVDTIYRLKSI